MRMRWRSIISNIGGEFLGLYARSGKIKEMARSSGRECIRSLLPIYRQIGRICELEFGHATLYAICFDDIKYPKFHEKGK